MLTPGIEGRFWIYPTAVDMRSGRHGLTGIISNIMKGNPLNGDAYIFFNKPHKIMRILFWDQDGYVIYSKWLEKGSFEKLLIRQSENKYAINYEKLLMLLRGISIKNIKQRKRYSTIS